MRIYSIFLSVIISLILTCTVSAQTSNANKSIDSFIGKQAKQYNADEYAEGRKIVRGDLNRDGKKETVVLYTLESFNGGNNNIQYLAVFLETKTGKLRYLTHKIVGGKERRAVESVSVENGEIFLDTLEYLSSDASCCPSKKGKTQIKLVNNKLRETKLSE
jgi:hypothetical protein